MENGEGVSQRILLDLTQHVFFSEFFQEDTPSFLDVFQGIFQICSECSSVYPGNLL